MTTIAQHRAAQAVWLAAALAPLTAQAQPVALAALVEDDVVVLGPLASTWASKV